MLVTPRTYSLYQAEPRQGSSKGVFGPRENGTWTVAPQESERFKSMLLVYQKGSVRVGEVVRYTLTYDAAQDRILPPPSCLHVKIKNTSAIPLRAAYLHGPYTLYTSCYPSNFDPNDSNDDTAENGPPEFEPNLKAGGSWTSLLKVPERVRSSSEAGQGAQNSGPNTVCTWVVEIASQIIFSTTAVVHFDLLVGRDEKALDFSLTNLTGHAVTPGQLDEYQRARKTQQQDHDASFLKGLFSSAIKLHVEDTTSLWNKPALPTGNSENDQQRSNESQLASTVNTEGQDLSSEANSKAQKPPRKRQKIHLVVLTHGLHSNLGADMLYLKESIDATAKKAREERRHRNRGSQASTTESEDEEEVVVRGFSGNACRTERGIQYLGKRLAKWILSMTYPDQPFLPQKKSIAKKLSRAFTPNNPSDQNTGTPEHKNSSIYDQSAKRHKTPAYKITSISFVAHSLGGLTQMYAIGYIHKHSPHFFDHIKPINFVAMAAPFLGLSNENPVYIKFALDFGLVGRTGQDLGLTWKPTAIRSGLDAIIAGIGSESQKKKKQQPDPRTKPLLRVLPLGPTHQVLKLFRNRTVYSNVVNDGIVPLRTSCLLFLDWSGLGRVEKARRDNGLVAGLAGWGWAELTGTNASARRLRTDQDSDAGSMANLSGDDMRSRSQSRHRNSSPRLVPEPDDDAVQDQHPDQNAQLPGQSTEADDGKRFQDEEYDALKAKESSPAQPQHPIAGLLSIFKPSPNKTHHHSPKHSKIYKRSQTIKMEAENEASSGSELASSPNDSRRPSNVRGNSVLEDSNILAPPKTTIFESAGDVLDPPLPTEDFIVDPKSRPRTIFHDRVYHPEDIPPPPAKKPPKIKRSMSSDSTSTLSRTNTIYEGGQYGELTDTSGLKVEEKIARAYHHGLSWRKVLVRLEPDAHNNMVVRRMFANAYGWPVVKHLVDTHFGNNYSSQTADEHEPSVDRAKGMDQGVTSTGEEVEQIHPKPRERTESEAKEAKDSVPELKASGSDSLESDTRWKGMARSDSVMSGWDDAIFEGTDDDDEPESPVTARRSLSASPESSRRSDASSPPRHPLRGDPLHAGEHHKLPILSTQRSSEPGAITASPVNYTSVGLRKSVEDQLAQAKSQDIAQGANNVPGMDGEESKVNRDTQDTQGQT